MSIVQTMSDQALRAELKRLGDKFEALRSDADGHGGSPGEWMVERMGEIEQELRARKALHR